MGTREQGLQMEKTLPIYLSDLRQEIAEQLLQVCKENESYILPIEVVLGTVLGRPVPGDWAKYK